MDFNLLFGDDAALCADGMQQQREEYRTFLYLRVLRRLCASDEPRQRQLQEFVRAATQRVHTDHEDRTALLDELLAELQRAGLAASVCHSRGSGTAGLLSFRHTFLQVFGGDDESNSQPLIVEPQLREEFQIVRPTPQYQRLLDALPREFVGSSQQLTSLVEFMSERMAESFRQRGMCSPPWRQVKSMLLKWELRGISESSKVGKLTFQTTKPPAERCPVRSMTACANGVSPDGVATPPKNIVTTHALHEDCRTAPVEAAPLSAAVVMVRQALHGQTQKLNSVTRRVQSVDGQGMLRKGLSLMGLHRLEPTQMQNSFLAPASFVRVQ